MSRIVARRARIPRRCSWCTPGGSPRKVIEPGQVYLRHAVIYPLELSHPTGIDQCAACARFYDYGHLIDQREANPR